jgi:hypothetical protein
LIPSITTTCPHCNNEITITGVKFVFDNPNQPTKAEPLKSKGYVGWGDKTEDIETEETRKITNVIAAPKPVEPLDNTIRIDNSAPDADTNRLILEQIKKQDEENSVLREELKKREAKFTEKEKPTLQKVIEEVNPQPSKGDNYKPFVISQEETKKEEDELVPLLKKLIPLLDTKIYPELHKIVSSLVVEEEAVKEQKPKFRTAW